MDLDLFCAFSETILQQTVYLFLGFTQQLRIRFYSNRLEYASLSLIAESSLSRDKASVNSLSSKKPRTFDVRFIDEL